MKSDLINELSQLNYSAQASEVILKLTNDINAFNEKLSSAHSLNLENVNFLLNNFLNRLKNKSFLTAEEKEVLITHLTQEGFLGASEEEPPISSSDKAIVVNLNTKIKDKTALLTSLNSSIVENQEKLIEEEAAMIFLEKNNLSSISQEEEHINSFELDETLSIIFDLNNQLPEKYQIQKDSKLYLNSDSMMNKLKVLSSSSPASIKALQDLVSSYENKENILSDLVALTNYVSTLATLEESSLEAQNRLNQKQASIDMLVQAINDAKNDAQKLEKDLKQALSEKSRLVGNSELAPVGITEVYNCVKENGIDILSRALTTPSSSQAVIYKLFGANAPIKIASLLNTYNAISKEVEKGQAQLSQLEETMFEVVSSLNFKHKRLAAEDKTFSDKFNLEFSSALSLANDWLVNIEAQYNSFASNAFDSSVEDYFEENLIKNLNIFDGPTFDSLMSQLSAVKEEMKNSASSLKKTLSM